MMTLYIPERGCGLPIVAPRACRVSYRGLALLVDTLTQVWTAGAALFVRWPDGTLTTYKPRRRA
jgi:hypothetical protein